MRPAKISRASMRPTRYIAEKRLTISVSVEDIKSMLVALENTFKFCKVDRKVITHTLEPAVKLSDLGKGQVDQGEISFQLIS
jgi:tRNA threonylcarbamoyladenosine modification (KEOPS) complex  Pcc1 subunit